VTTTSAPGRASFAGLDRPAVRLDDAPADRHAQAGPGRLRRAERLEPVLQPAAGKR
jgi:hypothetical protein